MRAFTLDASAKGRLGLALTLKVQVEFFYVLRGFDSAEQKVYSPWEYFGGFRWRLLIFPFGNQTKKENQTDEYISVYLDCGGPSSSDVPPEPAAADEETVAEEPSTDDGAKSTAECVWKCSAKFWLYVLHSTSVSLYNPVAPDMPASSNADIIRETCHDFSDTAHDWGFLEFGSHSRFAPGDFADEHMNIFLKVRIRLPNADEEDSEH